MNVVKPAVSSTGDASPIRADTEDHRVARPERAVGDTTCHVVRRAVRRARSWPHGVAGNEPQHQVGAADDVRQHHDAERDAAASPAAGCRASMIQPHRCTSPARIVGVRSSPRPPGEWSARTSIGSIQVDRGHRIPSGAEITSAMPIIHIVPTSAWATPPTFRAAVERAGLRHVLGVEVECTRAAWPFHSVQRRCRPAHSPRHRRRRRQHSEQGGGDAVVTVRVRRSLDRGRTPRRRWRRR